MDIGFGRIWDYGEKGVYNVVFFYIEEFVGCYVVKVFVVICEVLIDGKEYDLEDDI